MLFVLPTYFGKLPQESGSISTDITFTGQDGTTLIIKGGVGSTFSKDNSVEYASQKGTTLFQFIFPVATVMDTSRKMFTTPGMKYTFSEVEDVVISGTIKKNMKSGTVVFQKVLPLESTVQTFVDNVKREAVPATVNSIKDYPFYSLGYILYLFLMDMFKVFIFWILIASISCWLMVPSKYLYPTDVTKYPYVYYKEGGNAYGYLKQTDGEMCTLFTKGERTTALSDQAKLFYEINGEDKSIKNTLNILNPPMISQREDGVNPFSTMLNDRCAKHDPCTSDYMIYFVGSLFFYNYLYCNTILSGVHAAASSVKSAVSAIPHPIFVILLTTVLYILLTGVDAANDQIIHLLGIKMDNTLDIQTVVKNQFKTFLISILACCVCLVVPLCSILVVTCILTTAYVLLKTCLSPYNGLVVLFAVLTIVSSMSQYVFLIRNIIRGLNPMDLLEKLFVTDFNLTTIMAFMGVTVPIVFGLIYGNMIGIKLFLTFFRFTKYPEVKALMSSSVLPLALVALLLLFKHVMSHLGGTYAAITLSSIIIIGLSIYYQRMMNPEVSENNV